MCVVIKQFPLCKCSVYTFLLQLLSLDRLLEYEDGRYTMKNEKSETSIKSNLPRLLAALHALGSDGSDGTGVTVRAPRAGRKAT